MIQLDDKFHIEEDAYSWNLVEKVSEAKDREGNPKFDTEGKRVWNTEVTYHMNLRQALCFYLSCSQKGSKTVLDAVDRMLEAEERIEKAYR